MKSKIIHLNQNLNFCFPFLKEVKKIFALTIKEMKLNGKFELSLTIVNDEEMIHYCQTYKNQNKTTDVLSFENDWKFTQKISKIALLGDIIISYEKAYKQALEYNHSEKREFCFLFLHGLLHLLGYNHIEIQDEKIMNDLSKKIMTKAKIER